MKTIIIVNFLKFMNTDNKKGIFTLAYKGGGYINVYIHTDECERFLIENDIEFKIGQK